MCSIYVGFSWHVISCLNSDSSIVLCGFVVLPVWFMASNDSTSCWSYGYALPYGMHFPAVIYLETAGVGYVEGLLFALVLPLISMQCRKLMQFGIIWCSAWFEAHCHWRSYCVMSWLMDMDAGPFCKLECIAFGHGIFTLLLVLALECMEMVKLTCKWLYVN